MTNKELSGKSMPVKKLRGNRGITLISLVVSIVVLIILAAVSINAMLGQNGIIAKAKQAKDEYEASEANEITTMEDIADEIGGGGNIDPDTGWNLDKVNKVKSEDNVFVPVPKGYLASTVDGEKSVSGGFVIKEGNDGSKTEGINEFVWVPVENISDIYDEANNAGQLWTFSGTTSTKIKYPTKQNDGRREPDVITNAGSDSDSTSGTQLDAVSANLKQAGLSDTAKASDLKKQLQSEFNEMINSVKTYGGFYIGRYETGNLNQTKAVVQKNNADIDKQSWYIMYRLCKKIKANENVATSMIWGCQWDATLRWMQTSTDSEVANFPTDSTGKGNIDTSGPNGSAPIATGSNSNYEVNNIYDMAGNVFEETLEANDTHFRTPRGCIRMYTSSNIPASARDYGGSANKATSHGCRATLYVR